MVLHIRGIVHHINPICCNTSTLVRDTQDVDVVNIIKKSLLGGFLMHKNKTKNYYSVLIIFINIQIKIYQFPIKKGRISGHLDSSVRRACNFCLSPMLGVEII